MEITEVRIKLMELEQEERLLGFCSMTFDDAFVVRDLKIIRGLNGPFVAMPSRKLMDRCGSCGTKNQLRAAYCNQCGVALDDDRSYKHPDGKARLYSDIAHPINSECRDQIQERVLQAYEQELILARQPDYVCRYDDYGENDSPYTESQCESANEYGHLGSHDPSTRRRLDAPQVDRGVHHGSRAVHQSDDFGAGIFER